jgi:uncharacterized protein
MNFLVDQPLRGLAKWLRLGGFDAEVESFSSRDAGLPAPVAGRYLLTKQAKYRRQPREDLLVLETNDPKDQLAEVFRRLDLSRQNLAPLKRCGECNELLVPVPRESALGLVPDHVFQTQAEFFQCPRCRHLYWPGSHQARIIAELHRLIPEQPGSGNINPSSRKGAPHGV